jgi:hypothetical protein
MLHDANHQNVIVVALANKMVRMAWAVLYKSERCRVPVLAVTTKKSLFREIISCQVCSRKIEMAMGLSHAFET